MKKRLKVSVAMTTYNGERFVLGQLESFTNQERLPDELVISDDASTDHTVEIVREFANRAPFPVKLFINEHNLGIPENFGRAIERVSGDVIFLSDSDDYWYPEKIRVMEKAFEKSTEAGLVICNSDEVDERLRPLGVRTWAAIDQFFPSEWLLKNIALGKIYRPRMPAGGCCMAFRAKFKPLILPLPPSDPLQPIAYDHFIARMIICSGCGGAVLLPKPLLAYRMHAGQATNPGTTHFHARILERVTTCRNFPYQLPMNIERLESKYAIQHCINPEIRTSALRHWRARLEMPSTFIGRLPVVVREVLSLRYSRFSSGMLTAAKDLLVPRERY